MNFTKRVYQKLRNVLGLKELNSESIPFFTKDIFADKKYHIGEYTYGKPRVIFENKDANLFIGKFCSISDGVTIFLGGNHRTDWISTYPFNELPKIFPEAKDINGHPATKGDVKIGNDVWIGRNVTIMSGLTIEDGAVIGTESVVTKNIGPYEIWAGNPAVFIKKRFEEKTINELIKLKWWNWDRKNVVQHLNLLCSSNYHEISNQ